MGSKLRDKDYRTGYDKGWHDCAQVMRDKMIALINEIIDEHNATGGIEASISRHPSGLERV